MKHLVVIAGLMAFLTHEQQSGLNKLCFYQGPMGQTVITIPNYRMCPVSIEQ